MNYRRFGKTGLDMPALSAGFMRTMHSWQVVSDSEIPLANQENFEEVVRAALEHGIHHFETAHAYGTSEQQLGKVLQGIPRNKFILQTKVQPSSDPKKFINQVRDSLNRLQVDRVDLLAIHGINDYRSLWQVCRENGCLAAARMLQREGKTGAVGFSGHGAADVIVEAIRCEEEGGFDYVNLHWYYIYQVNRRALEEAAKRDMGVFIISPTDKGGMLQDPSEKLCQLCKPLTPMTFNDVYCLSRPEVHTISIGAAKPSDFSEHVGALNHLGSEKVITEIDEQCRREMARVTGFQRPDALWHKLPRWDESPGLINIPFILWLYNLARAWGLVTYSRNRYGKLGKDVKWVPGNNASGVALFDLKPIAEGIGMSAEELVRLLETAHGFLRQQ